MNDNIEYYHRILEEIEDYVIFLLDENECFSALTSGANNILSYTTGDIKGHPFSCLFTAADVADNVPANLVRQSVVGGKASLEVWITTKNLSRLWCKVTVIADHKGIHKNGRYSVIIKDLSEKKKADENLLRLNAELQQQCDERTATILQNEGRYRALLENNYDFITLKDAKGRVIYQSPAIERMIGYTAAETEGRNGAEFFHPEDIEDVNQRLQKAMANPGTPVWGRNRMKHKMGNYIWVEGTTTNLLHDENVKAVVANFRDITQRILIETSINQSREELKNSYRELETLLSNIDEVFVSLDTGFKVTSFNKKARLHVKKYLQKEIKKGEEFFEFIAPDLKEGFKEILIDVLKGNKRETEIAYKAENGEDHNFLNLIKPTINEKGEVEGIFITKRNITERVISRRKIEFDHSNLEALINNTNDLMWSIDVNSTLITSNTAFNDRVRRMAGVGEIDKMNPGVGFADDVLERWNKWYERAFAGETFKVLDHSAYPEEFITEVSFHPIFEGEKVIGTACYAHDITKARAAEEALAQSEANLRLIMDLIPQSIFSRDIHGNYIFVNNYFANFYGLDASQLINKNISVTFATEEERRLFHNQDKDIILSGERKMFHKVQVKDYLNNIHFFDVCKVPYLPAGKKEYAVLAIGFEITDKVAAELERTKMITEIIQRNKDLEQFSYIVSHNLRSPVSNIVGILEILHLPGITKAEEERVLNQLGVSVGNLDNVIKDLNDILKVKQQVNDVHELVYFSVILSDIQVSISNMIRKENVRIITDFTAVDEMITLKSYIYSIFFNLISNSIKYRQPDVAPVIEIKSAKTDDKISIVFKDNGLGIDLKKKGEQVFGLYKRFHSHTEGKGMGLFMVKTQVETIGGKVLLESEVNKGTTITIEFNI